jgi:hypothetical protein
MATLVLRTVKGSPLTNQEVDDNFNNLNTEVQAKLDSSTYTAADILTKLKTVDGSGSGLDADSVHGLVGSLTNTPSSLVGRDSNGDIFFETGHATLMISNLQGNVTGNVTGNVSGNALNVTGTVSLNNGGTGGTTAESARTNLGIGTLGTQNYNNVNITGGSITGVSAIAITSGGTGASTANQARSNLGLNIGSDIQAFSNELTAISSVANAADTIPYYIGNNSAASTALTSFGRSLIGSSTSTAAKVVLGLTIGADVQAYDSDLTAIAAISTAGFISRTGAGTAAARSLAAGSGISITNGDGVSGNPTISIPSNAALSVASVAASGQITATGGFVGSFTGTFSGVATNVSGIVAIANGGTGASTAVSARTNLGLGTVATQNAGAVTLTGGTISGLTSLGTGTISASGNATVGGTLQVTGATTLAVVNATTGNFSAGIQSQGDIIVASNKATISASTGNTSLAGTLNVSGQSTLTAVSATTGSFSGALSAGGDFKVNTNKFTVDHTTGNTTIANTLDVAGNTTLGITTADALTSTSTLNVSGFSTLSGNLYVGGTSTFTGVPTVPSIAKSGSNGVGNIGQTNNRFGVVYAASVSGAGADLAERYTADMDYEPGTVLIVLDDHHHSDATQSNATRQRVLGVVSTKPAFVMNDEAPGLAVALRGRVPVKVFGAVKKGQPLISYENGTAIFDETDGLKVFAIALENKLSEEVGLIECVIL